MSELEPRAPTPPAKPLLHDWRTVLLMIVLGGIGSFLFDWLAGR